VDRLSVDQIHVLLKSCVHEGNTVCTVLVVFWNGNTLFPEPLNSVASDTIVAAHTHAVEPSRSEHENAKSDVVTSLGRNLEIVCERVIETLLFPFELIILGHVPLALLGQTQHNIVIWLWAERLKVRRAGYPDKWLHLALEECGHLFVVYIPASVSALERTTDQVACNDNQLGLLH